MGRIRPNKTGNPKETKPCSFNRNHESSPSAPPVGNRPVIISGGSFCCSLGTRGVAFDTYLVITMMKMAEGAPLCQRR